MIEEGQLKTEVIDDKSPYLQTVIELGDDNNATLGFFPEGAFRKYAASRQIIVALDLASQCIGYLLYAYSSEHNRITIVHLCVTPPARSNGVAKRLFSRLKAITQEYSGIGLHCRRDYKLDKLWSSLGFVAKHDKPAKTLGKQLTYWWFDHGHPNLLSALTDQQHESKLCVVIDTEIFLELYIGEESKSEEAKSLLADWLQPHIELCTTDEIFNKINNESDENERNKQRNRAESFTNLPCQNRRLDSIIQHLKEFFNQREILVNEYEVRNIARTIASNVRVFTSYNSYLLSAADNIYDNFQLSIIRPSDLIIRLDELRRKPEYQPVRLAGTQLKQVCIQGGNEATLNNYFQFFNQGESKAEFQQQLLHFLTEVDKFECFVVLDGENQPLVLAVYGRHKTHELEIPMLRVADSPLAATITHHLIFQAALISAYEQRQFTRVTDMRLQEIVTQVLQKDAFIKANNGWLRANIAIFQPALHLSQYLADLANRFGQEYAFCNQIANNLNTDNAVRETQTMLDIERFLCPAKIIDADIPTFIIPIKPFWAQQLFDEKLANQTILGAIKTRLALNREAVYYRSKSAPRELKPGVSGRILWYVSNDDDRGYREVSTIRACSRLDEVVVGKPEELYRRFRDLGIYERQNIYNLARNDPDNVIMALRFSDTELFSKPIGLQKIQEILGNKVTMQTAFYIFKENFATVYALGV